MHDNILLSDVNRDEKDKMRKILNEVGIDYQKYTDDELSCVLSKEFGGVDLSGGEWQRIAIARGVYRNSDLVVLDEPTAAIDPIEEANVYWNFKKISQGRTSIIVTHRLASAKSADCIIVMNKGKVEENGTHADLIKKNGLYAKMFNTQSQWYNVD